MKLQKIGGIGSIGTAILVVIMLVIMLIVSPRLGLVGPSDWLDPVKSLDARSASPISFFILNLATLLCSIAYILIVLALRERMQASVPNLMRVVVIAVSVTCALWLASGSIGIFGMPSIVLAEDASAFRAANAMYFSLGFAGDSAAGWVLLLIGWAALKTRGLPRILSYLSVLKAIVMILEVAVQPFTLMLIGLLLGIVFYPWLGIVLLRSKS